MCFKKIYESLKLYPKLYVCDTYRNIFVCWLCPQHVEVPGPGIKPSPQHHLSCCNDNARSLTCCATRELPRNIFTKRRFIAFIKKKIKWIDDPKKVLKIILLGTVQQNPGNKTLEMRPNTGKNEVHILYRAVMIPHSGSQMEKARSDC